MYKKFKEWFILAAIVACVIVIAWIDSHLEQLYFTH